MGTLANQAMKAPEPKSMSTRFAADLTFISRRRWEVIFSQDLTPDLVDLRSPPAPIISRAATALPKPPALIVFRESALICHSQSHSQIRPTNRRKKLRIPTHHQLIPSPRQPDVQPFP